MSDIEYMEISIVNHKRREVTTEAMLVIEYIEIWFLNHTIQEVTEQANV